MSTAEIRPNRSAPGQRLLWCPFAKIIEPAMPTRGPYENSYPEGAIVHYTAALHGADDIAYGRKMGYAYMLVDREGVVYQAHPFDKWGYHAGTSSWPKLVGSVSRYLVGIELESAGLLVEKGPGLIKKDPLETLRTWYGTTVPKEEIRQIKEKTDNCHVGYYHTFTAAQESTLTTLLLWLKSNNPDVFNIDLVLGHDEVSPTRKDDPGGSLSKTMPAYRAFLQDEWKKQIGEAVPCKPTM